MLLVDTGVFVSVADRNDSRHLECVELFRGRGDLAVTASVAPEAAWLIETRLGPGAEALFLRLVTSSRFTIVDLTPADYQRTIGLIATYADLGLWFVDSSLIAVAERLGLATIATLNLRDFAVVRPTHCEAFELIP